MLGQKLAHFEIVGLLGEGGMGAVYSALDTRLDRRVAIKVLPQAFVADPERLARFDREAKALAALDHPGIVSIYSLETVEPETGGPPITFLVMELVEGRTLGHVIPPGGLPLGLFFELAVPIAETVSAAHRRGIVHRDLKPANIMVTSEGSIKVLDFGLAKWHAGGKATIDDEPEEAAPGEAPTRSLPDLTAENQIVGTGPYMSPEQIRSQVVDARSDIFSLGVVLFEMIARERPFEGDTSVDLISAILREAPRDLSTLRPEVPERLRLTIERCLEKAPGDRPASALELRDALADAVDRPAGERGSGAAERRGDDSSPALDPRFVAVLPFANLSRTEEADLLATGLHNDVLAELGRVPGLTVIARTSVMPYKETAKSARVIGEELGVGTLLEGTVQSAGNRVRLSAKLIDAAADVQRWAELYDREVSAETLFDLQSELTEKIVASLQSKLAPDARGPSRQATDAGSGGLSALHPRTGPGRAAHRGGLPARDRLFREGGRARPRASAGLGGPRRSPGHRGLVRLPARG